MKKILILMGAWLAMMLVSAKESNENVINSSMRETPEWVEKRHEGAIVVSAEALSLDEAHSKAEADLNKFIINQAKPKDFSLSEDVIAMLPVMRELNETRTTSYYWAKVENESTKEQCYRYWLCCPMSEKDLKLLNTQLSSLDREKCDELKKLSNQLGNVASESQLKENIEQIDTLECYFAGKEKLMELKKLRKGYVDLYKDLKPELRKMKEGQYMLTFKLNERPFKLTTMPMAIPEDRNIKVQVQPSNGSFTLTCTPADDLSGKKVTLSLVLDKQRQSYMVEL